MALSVHGCCILWSAKVCLRRNRKLEASIAPTMAKSREPANSKALNQKKIDRQRDRQACTVRRIWWMGLRVETSRGHGEEDDASLATALLLQSSLLQRAMPGPKN